MARRCSTWMVVVIAVAGLATAQAKVQISERPFGQMPDGGVVTAFTLTNANGVKATLIELGATLVSLEVPDRDGNMADVVLGWDTVEDYLDHGSFFGCIAGRYANRIAKGKFTLDGTEYTLATNNEPNHLHGGNVGFDKVVWKGVPFATEEGPSVRFTYLSKDGEEGYPGNLACAVTYTLTNKDELKIAYEAETDKATPVNLTHHSYFNLAGHDTGSVLDTVLMIDASRYTPVDDTLIPTGELAPVLGTPFDFTEAHPINAKFDQVEGGYDLNYVLDKTTGWLELAARATEPSSGRVMEVLTTEPGIQLYTGNFLNATGGKGGAEYPKNSGFCLETQRFPDTPNHPNFPSCILRPGDKYSHITIYRFSTE
ncbi:MAG: aldose 1-epimerase [Candidatus Hydrogenedentota bacterium]